MLQGAVTKVVACSAGLSSFAVAVVAGLAVNNPAEQILTRAILAMACMYLLGHAVGAILERVVRERAEQHMRDNPIPGGAGAAEEPLVV